MPQRSAAAVAASSTRPILDRALPAAVVATAIVLMLGYALEIVAFIRHVESSTLGYNIVRLDSEANIPSVFSSALMVVNAIIMLKIASAERRIATRTAVGWQLLGFFFIYMALDELLGVHEALLRFPYRPDFYGLFHFRWVLLGVVAVVVLFGLFLPFLLRLPRTTAIRLLIAGGVFVFGALVMEMIDGAAVERFGPLSWQFVVAECLEESLEMVGLVLALRTIILHRRTLLPEPPAAR